MTEVLVRHHAKFYSMVKLKMASVGHIDTLSIDHGPIIAWVYPMGDWCKCASWSTRESFQNARAAFRKLGKQPQTPP